MSDETIAGAFDAPPPSRELRRLEPLIGTWLTEDHTHESVLGPSVPVRSLESMSWLDGGYFLMQTYRTRFGREPAQRGVGYWGYDEADRRFREIFFSNNGPFTEEGNRYEGCVEGDRLTFTGPARFQYRLDSDGKILVDPDGSLTVEWWLRDSAGHWQPWMTNRFIRMPAPPNAADWPTH